MTKIIFLSSLASGLMMTGLIWMVQIVQYPGFRTLDSAAFQDLHQFHVQAISFVVMPLMLAELISTLAGTIILSEFRLMWWLALGFVMIIWVTTFFLSVPAHNLLSGSFSPEVLNRLISTNWIRTGAWTLKSAIMLYYAYQYGI